MTAPEAPYTTCSEFMNIAVAVESRSADVYRSLQSQCTGSALQLLEMLERQSDAHREQLKNLQVADPNASMQFPPDIENSMLPPPMGTSLLRSSSRTASSVSAV